MHGLAMEMEVEVQIKMEVEISMTYLDPLSHRLDCRQIDTEIVSIVYFNNIQQASMEQPSSTVDVSRQFSLEDSDFHLWNKDLDGWFWANQALSVTVSIQ